MTPSFILGYLSILSPFFSIVFYEFYLLYHIFLSISFILIPFPIYFIPAALEYSTILRLF